MSTYINLTPHPIIIIQNGEKVLNIPPFGHLFRLKTITTAVNHISENDFTIPVRKVDFKVPTTGIDIVKLARENPDNIYIISLPALLMLKNTYLQLPRNIVAPDTDRAYRDENGRIIGVPGFITL